MAGARRRFDVTADLLLGFPGALRNAGLPVDPGRGINFLAAVRVARLSGLADLARAGRVTLTSSPDDFPVFDQVFESWFGCSPGLATVRSPDEQLAPRDDRPRGGFGMVEPSEGTAAGKAADDDQARGRKNFGNLAEGDRATLARIQRGLHRLPTVVSRKWRAAPRGPRIDLPATTRAARRSFGETIALMRMSRPDRPRRLLLLIDVSGSMKTQSEAYLRFAHLLTRARPRVETFCFGTRLSRVTATLRRRDVEDGLARLSEVVFDFDGGTRIGRSLSDFLSVSRHAALVRGAVTIVFSDGLERGEIGTMAHAVNRLARLSHRIVWATPLAADPRYRPVTRAMAAILPSLDAFVDGSDLSALEAMVHQLRAIETGDRAQASLRFSRSIGGNATQ